MPIYEYQCDSCAALHEVLQKISDPPLTDCPACGAAALRKKVSAAAFRLKGGGWYETDFKSGNKKNLAGDAGSDSGNASKEGSGGQEGKGGKTGGDSAKASDSASAPKADTRKDSSTAGKPGGGSTAA
jgi:putative FmdB family regulatory protein